MTQISELFRRRRSTLGISKNQVVGMTPYKNVAKGVFRLTQLESGEWAGDEKVLAWFASSLDIPMEEVHRAWTADQNQTVASITGSLPADVCVKCNNPLAAVGGRMIVFTPTTGVILRGDQIVCPGRWSSFQGFQLEGIYKNLYLVFGGNDWPIEAVDRACQQAQSGKRPWICQVCADKVCDTCNSPLQYCHACSLLNIDGGITYAAILPIPSGCTSQSCNKHRPAMQPGS
jgi:hypothetical protein